MNKQAHKHLLASSLLLATIASLLLSAAHARTWTSADGTKTFEGELRSYDPATGTLSVTLAGGKQMKFTQDKLSSADIAFLKEKGKVDAASAQNFYVDPVNGSDAPGVAGTSAGTAFRSLARARGAVRAVTATQSEDIIVHLRKGDYAFTSTLAFTEADSGRNGHRVIWQPYPGEFPVMEGGKQITGWTLHDSANGIWKASVSTPENFRNLYVNGSRRERATRVGTLTSNHNNWYLNPQGKPAGVYVADTALGNITNPADMEVLWKRDWRHFVIPVTGVESGGAGKKLILLDPTVFEWAETIEYAAATPDPKAPFSISNAYEFLVAGAAGSFYLDRTNDTVFYKKLPAEDMATAKVYVPVLDGSFLNIAGSSPTDRVKNVTFRGLTFQHGGLLWTEQNGAICFQAACWANSPKTASVTNDPSPTLGYRPAAAIDVRNADGLVFEENALEHLGGCGIALDTAVSNVAIRKNRISDISEGAITVSSWRNNNLNANEGPVNHITIENNYVESIGREYPGAVGILLFWVQDCVVQNNYLRDLPYSGISLGWGWAAPNITNFSARNAVRNNRIEEYMLKVFDGGGIYTLGRRPDANNGDVIEGNYCLDMYNRNAGLYADEGTSFTTWRNNVVENVTQFWHDMWTSTIRDNTVNNNYTTTASFRNKGTNNTITNSLVHPKADWPPAARAIISAAGISSAHAAPVPTGFSAIPNQTAGINLSWTAVPGTLGYEIERRLAVGKPWTLVAELPADSTSYVDAGSSKSQAPVYRIRSVTRLNDSVPVSTTVSSASAK